jgi:trk system potassium uptake protein TrkA
LSCSCFRQTCEILNQPIKDISGPDDPFHVVAIKRGAETIIPGGNDVLQLYDLAYFMTTREYIPYIRKIVGKEHYIDVKNVMVMGGGRTAVRAVKTMPEYMNVKIIESDEHRCEQLNELFDDDRTLIINGDGRDLALLQEEGIKNTQAFVALTKNAETNILACLTAKRMGVRKTVAMVENVDYISMADSLDIGTIINKKAIAASYIYQMMLDANVHNVRFIMNINADVAEFIPQEGAKVVFHLCPQSVHLNLHCPVHLSNTLLISSIFPLYLFITDFFLIKSLSSFRSFSFDAALHTTHPCTFSIYGNLPSNT